MTRKVLLRNVFFLMSCLTGVVMGAKPSSPPKQPITKECYTAAIYEHVKQEGTPEDSAQQVMDMNLAIYAKATEEAAKREADIIVFPEYGLFGDTNDSRALIRPYLENIPAGEEGKNPCDDPKPYLPNSFLVTLSCMAKKHSIYLVANVGDMKPCDEKSDPKCPDDGAYQYNTNVVFDRAGTLISRYHKKHLFYEYKFNEPDEFEYQYFDTEFGRFATYVCFDLLFKNAVTLVEEYHVDTILFPTWWFNALPTLTSTQPQEGMALINKVNLLAANIQNPELACAGSGIYAGVNGAVNIVQKTDGVPRLLISRIPSQSGPGKVCQQESANGSLHQVIPFPEDQVVVNIADPIYKPLPLNVSQYAFVKLTKPKDTVDVCHNGLCCELDYELAEGESFIENEPYHFSVYSGRDNSNLHYFWCVEVCVITNGYRPMTNYWRIDSNAKGNMRFKRLHIRGVFSTKYVYPSVAGNDTFLIPMNQAGEFSITDNTASITVTNSKEEVFSASLMGRCYDRDPEYKQ